jgi:hypothetical protein
MRFLFAFVGGNGHFQPLVPIARAVQAAGHIVAFACSHSMANTVEALAFAAIPIGKPGNGKPERLPLRPVNMEREEHDLREKFARQAARSRAAGILETCAVWKPDLIICDEVDFGSMIAAERLGIPHVTVLVIAAGSFVRAEIVADALNEVRAEYDLPSDPNLRMLSRYLVLSPFPPGLRDPAFPLPSTAYAIQPELDPSNITDDAIQFTSRLVRSLTTSLVIFLHAYSMGCVTFRSASLLPLDGTLIHQNLVHSPQTCMSRNTFLSQPSFRNATLSYRMGVRVV